jgi:hypothetical protein
MATPKFLSVIITPTLGVTDENLDELEDVVQGRWMLPARAALECGRPDVIAQQFPPQPLLRRLATDTPQRTLCDLAAHALQATRTRFSYNN